MHLAKPSSLALGSQQDEAIAHPNLVSVRIHRTGAERTPFQIKYNPGDRPWKDRDATVDQDPFVGSWD